MRLLVIEDQETVASFIVKGLREEGYAVDQAGNGLDGLRLARQNPYDAIVLDVLLPGMNGLDVLKTLRERSAVPVLMLTARNQVEDKVRGLDAGADDYLTKPFAFAELTARLRSLLRRRDALTPSILRVADLELNPSTRQVHRGGRRIELSAREFSLLELLMRNVGRVLTRTTIIEHVWDIHFDSDTNIIDVYIRHLRQKLDDDGSGKLIQTVRGVGYALRPETP